MYDCTVLVLEWVQGVDPVHGGGEAHLCLNGSKGVDAVHGGGGAH